MESFQRYVYLQCVLCIQRKKNSVHSSYILLFRLGYFYIAFDFSVSLPSKTALDRFMESVHFSCITWTYLRIYVRIYNSIRFSISNIADVTPEWLVRRSVGYSKAWIRFPKRLWCRIIYISNQRVANSHMKRYIHSDMSHKSKSNRDYSNTPGITMPMESSPYTQFRSISSQVIWFINALSLEFYVWEMSFTCAKVLL